MLPLILLIVVFVPMLVEARLATRNDRALRSAGAIEPPDDVLRLMQAAYPTCFLAMVVEGWVRGSGVNLTFVAGAGLFALGKALKYWAIATLGDRWTFRVLVPPQSTRIVAGPYRFLRHPNYVGVAGELAGMALMAQAPLTGVVAIAGFGALMVQRIRVEERELGTRGVS
jgi:methyltransferase